MTESTPESVQQTSTDSAPVRPRPDRARYWLVLLAIFAVGAVVVHTLGLRAIWASTEDRGLLLSEQREWQARLTERSSLTTEWEKLQSELRRHVNEYQSQVASLATEVQAAQVDCNRITGDLARQKEELDLIRKAADEATARQKAAAGEKDRLDAVRKEVEASVTALREEEKRVRTVLEDLRVRQERAQSVLDTSQNSLLRQQADIATSKKQNEDLEKERGALRTTLDELDAKVRASKRALTEAQAKLDASQADATAAQERAREARNQEGVAMASVKLLGDQQHLIEPLAAELKHGRDELFKLEASLDEARINRDKLVAEKIRLTAQSSALQESIDEMTRSKTQLSANAAAAQKEQDRLDQELAARRASLRVLDDRIIDLQGRLPRLNDSAAAPPQTQPSKK